MNLGGQKYKVSFLSIHFCKWRVVQEIKNYELQVILHVSFNLWI